MCVHAPERDGQGEAFSQLGSAQDTRQPLATNKGNPNLLILKRQGRQERDVRDKTSISEAGQNNGGYTSEWGHWGRGLWGQARLLPLSSRPL